MSDSTVSPMESSAPRSAPTDPGHSHLRTDHLLGDLRGRSVRGGAVTLAAEIIKFVVHMGSTAILARLLFPQDFGLVAMVSAVTGFVAMFKDAGLSMATIQRQNVTQAQISTLFWINVALGVLVMLVVLATAPAIAWLYGEPRLIGITLALSGTFVFGGLTVQHQALLRRQMRFRALAAIDVASLSGGTAAGILMAMGGCGYWSLVGMTAVSAVVNCVLVWTASGWRPGWVSRGSGVGPMLRFGGNMTGASVLNFIGRKFDVVALGWWSGPAALGTYTKAYSLMTLPLGQLNVPIGAVAIPALSRTADRSVRYREAYLEVVSYMMAIAAPAVALAVVYSAVIVDIFLGPGWDDAATIFSVLGFAAFVLPLWNSTGWLFVSQDRMRDHLRYQAVDVVVKLGMVATGLYWGPVGVAAAIVCRCYMMLPVLFWVVGRKGPVRARDLYRMLLLSLTLAVVCIAVLSAGRTMTGHLHPFLDLACGGGLTVVGATAGLLINPTGRRVLTSLYALLSRLARTRRPRVSATD